MVDEIKYEYKTVQTVRGTGGLVISKMQKDGWELVEQLPGRLRTTLNFRRPKKPLPWRLIGVGAAVLVVLAAIIGTGVVLSGGDEEKDASASSTATSEKPSATPTVDESTAAEVITAQNNPEFAALLKADPCDEANVNFATKHEGQMVAFDGSVRHMASYGDDRTRYDFLLGPGDKGSQTTDGPNFKYEDVNTGNLHLTGKQVPATVAVGDKFRFVAEVVEFNMVQCVFRLAPVSTETR
ncbi:DUF4839 domain-containing protein [Streptomyces fructofermentans]|uniref:DUF4839 domain-containing protein n=1 Tax=Streptomyces fructofermentans TaxID=152141 RepID=A0A918U5L4_9ACTN|nr:DUF4839 domain-containing protein [Streptomyces fructofermentans]GGX97919.1 hypothetical protein GCM10010515_75330 [Streptomyces fructofermentans]